MDTDTSGAFYCFIHHGWCPSQYLKLPLRERCLIIAFIQKEAELLEEAEKRGD